MMNRAGGLLFPARGTAGRLFLVFLSLLGLSSAQVHAQGVAELSLDRGAVRALLAAAMVRPLIVPVASWGSVTIQVTPPRSVQFVDGGVEADLEFTLQELELSVGVHVRYEPQVNTLDGTVSLVATEAVPDVLLPVDIDLASLLPAADLPRRLSWTLDGPDGQPILVQALIQGVVISDERLVVQLGLQTRGNSSR